MHREIDFLHRDNVCVLRWFAKFLINTALILVFGTLTVIAASDSGRHLRLTDVFSIENATDPQISPNGESVIYVRNYFDIMTDRHRTELWLAKLNGEIEPLLPGAGIENAASPRWSPDGKRVAFVSTDLNGKAQLFSLWVNSGKIGRLTALTEPPFGVSWSPDGSKLAFFMRVDAKPKAFAKLPAPPKGAKWAENARVVTRMRYRSDGSGFLPEGFTHLFVVSSNGGVARQITTGDFNHGGRVAWSGDGGSIYFSANRSPNWEFEPSNSEIYKIDLKDGSLNALTDRFGPDSNPVLSPNGKSIVYTGYDDKLLGYHNTELTLMNLSDGSKRLLTKDFDRSVSPAVWNERYKNWMFTVTNRGEAKLCYIAPDGDVLMTPGNLGSNGNGRPYAGDAGFTVSMNGTVAYTITGPDRPGDVAVMVPNGETRVLTNLSEGFLSTRDLGKVTEIKYQSGFDKREIQGWYITPPDFDPKKKYPLILEIHGGPFADYGPSFTSELQLMAARGYVVLYTNPRGSASYGAEFANQIHHNYPSNDYDDLMSGVDAMIGKGFIDENSLFVTGGSGGGVLTAWIVGKTDRFKAAVVSKPVINWFSFSLTADNAAFFTKYWFSAAPWEDPVQYYRRSPISLVGNVKTPTMLLTGEDDLRTPISETEQFYQALKLRKIDTAMVRIPGAGHGIAARPSQLMAKVANILGWFEKYGGNGNIDQ